MIIIILAIAVVLAGFLAKKYFVLTLRHKYEKSLLNGDKKKSIELGNHYYLALNEETRKAKGINNIDAKISDDFRAFNDKCLSMIF
jgi:ABC-type uncharacterized transport system fused permease/ATPase subunit